MAETKLAPNHKDLEQMNKECKEKYPDLEIVEYKHEIRGIQSRKYVLVSNGNQEKWMMWDNLMKRGCNFSKNVVFWNKDNIQEAINSMGYDNVKVLDTYSKKTGGQRYVLLTDGNKIIERLWGHLYKFKTINFYPRLVYTDEKIQKMIDDCMYDCEIVSIEEKSNSRIKKERLYITFIYKKREMTNTLRHAITREFTKSMNEDILKEKYPTIDWERFEILRLYSERKSGKYRILADFKDKKYNEFKIGVDTSNLPIPTMSGLNMSEGELKIREWLIENNISYETEKTFEGMVYKQPLRLDFYLPKHNIGVEFDGAYHFHSYDWVGGDETLEINKLRDSIKNKYCEDNNIKLIRIPYWEYKNIANILTQEIV